MCLFVSGPLQKGGIVIQRFKQDIMGRWKHEVHCILDLLVFNYFLRVLREDFFDLFLVEQSFKFFQTIHPIG
jgi:hypothetical protein